MSALDVPTPTPMRSRWRTHGLIDRELPGPWRAVLERALAAVVEGR